MASISRTPDRISTVDVDDQDAKLQIYLDPYEYDYDALLEIEHRQTWDWGLSDDETAELLSHSEAPDWMREIVRDAAGVAVV